MAGKRGSKLHSIIEKLSEQCVRVSPQQDFNEEDEPIVTVIVQPPKQKKTQGNKKGKKNKKKLNNIGRKALLSTQNVYEHFSPRKVKAVSCQPVDDDLCIDVNALMCIGPQMQDIDVALVDNSLLSEPGTCRLCHEPVKNRHEFLDHLKHHHAECLKTSKPDEDKITEVNTQENEKEEIEDNEETSNHSDTDPDFDLDSEFSDSGVGVAAVPVSKRTRRSARLQAIQTTTSTNENQSETGDDSGNDIHIDVKRFMNTSSKLDDIDLPKTKQFPCKLCEKKYYFQIELTNHARKIHPDSEAAEKNKQNWKCEHCGKMFSSKKGLTLHIKKIVRKIEQKQKTEQEKIKKHNKEFTCTECRKIFKTNCSLKKHKASHTDDRPYKCDLCERMFKDKSYVYRHMKTHTGIKNYQCNYCKKLFAHRGSLRSHIMLHTGERPFQCQYCESGFISRFDLKVHENKHTGNMPYKCSQCPKSFPKSNNLKMHLISHSTAKPFPCEICGKAFKRRDHLRYHLIIHSDNKPFKCDTCNKTFNQNICLRKHLPCRELEKLEKRANKPKDQPKKAKTDKKSPQQTKIAKKTNNDALIPEDEQSVKDKQNVDTGDKAQIPLLAIPNYPDNSLVLNEKSSINSSVDTCISHGEIPNQTCTEPSVSLVHKTCTCDKTSEEPSLLSHHCTSVNACQSLDKETSSDVELSSLLEQSTSSPSRVLHHSKDNCFNFDKMDFSNELRTVRHIVADSSIQRLSDNYNIVIQQPFVPFNCSSQDASGVYESGGLELDALQADGSHSNMLVNRTFSQDNSADLSSALLAAMDPDNLSAMVANTTAFFPQT